jgi:hypothetical protein
MEKLCNFIVTLALFFVCLLIILFYFYVRGVNKTLGTNYTLAGYIIASEEIDNKVKQRIKDKI